MCKTVWNDELKDGESLKIILMDITSLLFGFHQPFNHNKFNEKQKDRYFSIFSRRNF